MAGCNGTCVTEAWAEKLQRAARRELGKLEPGTPQATFLLGEIHILGVVLDGPDHYKAAPLVRPTPAVCPLPAPGEAATCPT